MLNIYIFTFALNAKSDNWGIFPNNGKINEATGDENLLGIMVTYGVYNDSTCREEDGLSADNKDNNMNHSSVAAVCYVSGVKLSPYIINRYLANVLEGNLCCHGPINSSTYRTVYQMWGQCDSLYGGQLY